MCSQVSGFASNIYFPAIPTISRDLDVSIELINLTVTSYLIFQGIAPSLWGPLSDVKGRRIAYFCTFLVFLAACIGLSQTKSFACLLALRCLQSTGSASTIAIGSGVIGDITTRAERGGLMGVFQAGLLAPVVIGPIIGGALSGSLGWRSVFWFLTIYAAVFLACLVLLLPETLRSLVGNGGRKPSNPIAAFPLVIYQRTTKTVQVAGTAGDGPAKRKRIDVLGPLSIIASKQAAPIIAALAIHYAVWQMSITAMSTLFEKNYHLDETKIGLTFIANGTGSIVGTLVSGRVLDLDFRRVKAKFESDRALHQSDRSESGVNLSRSASGSPDVFPLEKARLRLVPIFSLLQCLSILLFGWTIQYPGRIPIAIPIISTFVTGWTAISMQSVVTTYLVDVFSDRSAAASASLNLARCLLAAGGTSFIMPLIDRVGVGWAFTVCGLALMFGLLGISIQWKLGGTWRRTAAAKKREKAAQGNGEDA